MSQPGAASSQQLAQIMPDSSREWLPGLRAANPAKAEQQSGKGVQPHANGSDNAMPQLRGAHFNVEGVSHRYRNSREFALDNVSLSVEPEESVALIGRSGCGKSTLLHILAGLIRPTQGAVHIDGAVVTGPSPSWVMMFQQPSLLPWMTVAQNVALGLRFTNRTREAPQRVAEMLKLVELGDYADRNVQDLSGGQQQRVALARSLAPAPQALLLDEPFSALDAFTRASLQRDVRRIVRELGITLVLVTHDINEAALMADRALVMTANPGRIFAEVEIDADQGGESASLQRARKGLMEAYEAAAGMKSINGLPQIHGFAA